MKIRRQEVIITGLMLAFHGGCYTTLEDLRSHPSSSMDQLFRA